MTSLQDFQQLGTKGGKVGRAEKEGFLKVATGNATVYNQHKCKRR